MKLQVDETLQLQLDCVAQLSPRRVVVYGWALTPRGVGTEISIAAGRAGDCVIEHVAFHARPDVVPADPQRAVVNGFALVFAAPENAAALSCTVTAGPDRVSADLRDPQIDTDLLAATAGRDWRDTFRLLQDCATHRALAPMLGYRGRPYGAFADWLQCLPAVAGRAEQLGPLAEVELLCSPAGEVLALLRSATGVPADASIAAAVLGRGPAEGHAGTAPRALALIDPLSAVLPDALVLYGRIDPALIGRLPALELVLHAELQPGQHVWLRGQPRLVAMPDFLDAISLGAPGLALLRQVLARREAAFAPMLAMLAAPAPAVTPAEAPRTALILGADDPFAARLFHVAAREFESRCDRLLVLGEAAEAVAQVFAWRGRLTAVAGAEAAHLLRESGTGGGIMAIDAVRFAEAVIAGDPASAFANPLDAAALARLLALHAVAGTGLPLADSLALLLRLRRVAASERPGEVAFAPVVRPWSSHLAADLVTDHLARLWTQPAAPRLEVAPHA